MASFADGIDRATRMLRQLLAVLSLAVVLLVVLSATLSQPAFAQSASEPEPYRNVDDFGVDLSSGTFNFAMQEVTGGSAGTGIDVGRSWGRSGWKDAYAGHLKQTGGSSVVIVRGSVSESFTLTSGTWVPAKANGAKLVKGTQIRFRPSPIPIAMAR